MPLQRPPQPHTTRHSSWIRLQVYADQALLYPCLHVFDFELLRRWLETFDTCPDCRQSVVRIERMNGLEEVRDDHRPPVLSDHGSCGRMRDVDRRMSLRSSDRMPLFDASEANLITEINTGVGRENTSAPMSKRQRVVKSIGRAIRRIRRFFRRITAMTRSAI